MKYGHRKFEVTDALKSKSNVAPLHYSVDRDNTCCVGYSPERASGLTMAESRGVIREAFPLLAKCRSDFLALWTGYFAYTIPR